MLKMIHCIYMTGIVVVMIQLYLNLEDTINIHDESPVIALFGNHDESPLRIMNALAVKKSFGYQFSGKMRQALILICI